MDILYFLIPFSVGLVFVIGGIFWWALHNNQFDDLDEMGQQILSDSDVPE